MRNYPPAKLIDTSLLDRLPAGDAFYMRDANHDMWAVGIGDLTIAEGMDKSIALWFATQINDARGGIERSERGLLKLLLEKYPST